MSQETASCFALGRGAASLSGYSAYPNAESSVPTVKLSLLGIFGRAETSGEQDKYRWAQSLRILSAKIGL
jgi:hypothetical protein